MDHSQPDTAVKSDLNSAASGQLSNGVGAGMEVGGGAGEAAWRRGGPPRSPEQTQQQNGQSYLHEMPQVSFQVHLWSQNYQ